ncbi:MAG: hypothetical protein J7M19_05165 [Planctomycetes bacterium]|nr:hypothetical protein [Planctomycetota bacterium]
MKSESSNGSLEKYGFSQKRGSAHMARTMMLLELRHLLDSVPASSPTSTAYVQAIEEDNCLGKRSHRTRVLTRRHLMDLYALSPDTTLFRTLRYFWQRDSEGRPLIAALCAYARDPLLRITAPFVLKLSEGQVFSREALEEYLEKKYPGRFSKATLISTAQNLASSWTQIGHLSGRVKKVRSKAKSTAGSTAYALFLGFLTGERGESLFKTNYARLLDCSFERAVELAETASRKGWIVFKRVSNVIEVLFPALLTQQEMEWIREQN